MDDSDFFICEAFRQILVSSGMEGDRQLNEETTVSLANYLAQLPPQDHLNPAIMANHITAFCQQPGNEELKEWLGEVYDRLDRDGIDKLVKKTGDPGPEVDSKPITPRLLYNEGRNACQFLQKWATEVQTQNVQGNQNVSQPKSP